MAESTHCDETAEGYAQRMIAETRQESAEEREVTAAQRIRVLLIEDNPGDARLIELMLKEADGDTFEVRRAERLDQALRELGRGETDVVLSDLSLPDSQGMDTFLKLHGRIPHCPIIVLSGLDDTNVALNAVHLGAQDYLVKGQVDGQLLARSMRYAIERKRMSEQLHRYAAELREKMRSSSPITIWRGRYSKFSCRTSIPRFRIPWRRRTAC